MLAASYDAEAREISNWRTETLAGLEPKPVAIAAALLSAERPVITRCVKLNNYWCIKSARWDGEIGRDSEGHVGFASADHGADAAVNLLRRYYLEFGRNPPSISFADGLRRNANIATGIGGLAVLAVRGIGGTVRAQYLASRRGKGVTTFTVTRARRKARPGVHDHSDQNTAIPGARYRGRNGRETKATATKAGPAADSDGKARAGPESCKRRRRLCARSSSVCAIMPTAWCWVLRWDPDDLQLFARDGMPSENLAAVMTAMASFELGMLRPTDALIDAALRRAVLRAEAAKATDREGPKL